MKREIYGALIACTLLGLFCITPARPAEPALDPVALVNPLIGTTGAVNTFPGADAPFGMVQWSPDTPSRPPGGGYDYADAMTSGFSLTHLSGPGCLAFGDFPILPVTGAITDPANAGQVFSHQNEEASPGWYSAVVGAPGIRAELTVTPRTGLSRFTFPSSDRANLIINTSGGQGGDTDAHFDVTSSTEVTGSATTGHFCGSPGEFTVYFAAQFDRPIVSYGTWSGSVVRPGTPAASGPGTGGWVTFDASTNHIVMMRVGVSFVSVDGARGNLLAENNGWDLDRVRRQTAQAWRVALDRIAIAGGTPSQQRTFYTAFYHALLHPNIFSDADGAYAGFDGKIHHVRAGHAEYANFSGWDIYRTQVPLIALLMPRETSDMMQSIVDDANDGGWLPRWPLANVYTDAMNGDSADPMIASAFAFGARDFASKAALRAMVKGATQQADAPGQGWYVERPDLEEYLRFGYVTNAHTNSVSPVPNGASETLEYALDDFNISRLADAVGDSSAQKTFAARARNWANLFDSATGLVAPRDAAGAFLQVPASESGQSGFQEGNAVQYSWLVPHDLRALFDAMGGDAVVARRLDDFFTQLDAGAGKPYAWLGNEPSMLQPWLYLSAREPWRTQAVVRSIETTLYDDTPSGEAGNDDLGTMSAWYVWSAIGLYPQTPGVPLLDIGSPLFSNVTIASEDGRTISIDAPLASTESPYVQAMRVNGHLSSKTWLMVPRSGSTKLGFDLGAAPNTSWGSAPGDGPPSWGFSTLRVPPATSASISLSTSSLTLSPDASATLTFGLSNKAGTAPVTASWRAQGPQGLSTIPDSGLIEAGAGESAGVLLHVSADPQMAAGYYDIAIGATAANGAAIPRVIATLRLDRPGTTPQLAYVMNFSDGTVQPIDTRSRTFGPAITVGANPGDAALSPDGSTLYVANQGSQSVTVINVRNLNVLDTIRVGKTPAGIRITPDGRTVWVSDYGDDDVRAIDTATHVAGAPIAVGKKPEELAIAPDGLTVYVVNQGSNSVTPIDARTRAVRAPIPVGRVPIGIVIAPDGKTAYVTNMGSNDITPIDLATSTAQTPIKVGLAPQQPAISPDGKTMYVPNSGSNTVTPIDLTTGRVSAQIRVGNGPFYVIFSPDGATAFVTNTGDNACIPIEVATRQVGRAIATGNFPIAIVR